MLELSSNYWYVLWGIMTAAFVCAWVFIVLGCWKIDSGADDPS